MLLVKMVFAVPVLHFRPSLVMGESCSEALRWVERLMLLLLLHLATLTHCPCLLHGAVLHLQSPGAGS